MEKAATHGLPPIATLFSDSWKRFTQSILGLLIFTLTDIAGYIVLFLSTLILIVVVGFSTGVSQSLFAGKWQSLLSPAFLSGVGIVGVLYLIGTLAIGLLVSAAYVYTIDHAGRTFSYLGILKKSFSRIGPLFVLGILAFFLVFGGLMFFIIPGVFVGFFLMFSLYEVVLQNKSTYHALGKSVLIVKRHFSGILGRALILWGIIFLYTLAFNGMYTRGSGVWMSLSYVINIGIQWFSLCYVYTLYKQASAGMEDRQPSSLLWIWIVAIVGWIVGIALTIGIYSTVTSPLFQKAFMKGFSGGSKSQMQKNTLKSGY